MSHDVRVGVTLPLAGKQMFAIAVALQLLGCGPVLRFRRVGFLEQSTSVNQDTTLEVVLPRSCTITPGGTDGQGINHDVHVTVGLWRTGPSGLDLLGIDSHWLTYPLMVELQDGTNPLNFLRLVHSATVGPPCPGQYS